VQRDTWRSDRRQHPGRQLTQPGRWRRWTTWWWRRLPLTQEKARNLRPARFCIISRRSECVRQGREQQERHDVRALDHRIDGRARRVLVGIADRIAGDRRLVGFRTLAAVIAVLDELLGIVPGAAARRHRDRDE